MSLWCPGPETKLQGGRCRVCAGQGSAFRPGFLLLMAEQRALRTHSTQGGLAQGLMLETRSDSNTCPSDLPRQVTGAGCLGPAARGPWHSGRCKHVLRTAIFQPCAMATGVPRECLQHATPTPDRALSSSPRPRSVAR